MQFQSQKEVNINEMTLEEVDSTSVLIGDQVRNICDKTAEKINKILKNYGMSAKIAIQFDVLNKKDNENNKLTKKTGRKHKKANL